MTDQQFYVMNAGLFIYLGGRMDKLVEKVGELDRRVAILEERAK